jgi:hypothetical protein
VRNPTPSPINDFDLPAFLGNLIAGGLASVFSSVLQVPLEVISQRQQIQDRTTGYAGTIGTASVTDLSLTCVKKQCGELRIPKELSVGFIVAGRSL